MKNIYFLVVFIILTASVFSQTDPRVLESITVSNNIGSSTTLYFGLDSLATDELDPQFGEANLPPLPPTTAWDTRLLLPEGGFSGVRSSYKDFRNVPSFPFTGSKEHRIQYQVGNGTTVTIDWNLPQTITGRLQDIITGTLIDAPMNDSGSYTVAQPSIFNKLKMTIDYQGAIPVELVSFGASIVGNNTKLIWQTASELNNSGFEIQRKWKNTNWQKIGFVNGAGTTTEIKNYSFTDKEINNEVTYYRLRQVDFDGSYSYSKVVEVQPVNPVNFNLSQNYPNPFNPVTSISFSIPSASSVKLTIYNQIGEKVAELLNENLEAGVYSYNWNASKQASGIYFYELQANDYRSIRKMTLLK
jgi:hypothetical protein